jgi:hypothetical protein
LHLVSSALGLPSSAFQSCLQYKHIQCPFHSTSPIWCPHPTYFWSLFKLPCRESIFICHLSLLSLPVFTVFTATI